MKKILVAATLILLVAVIGAGLFAANQYRINERFGFFAEAQDGVTVALEREYLAEISFNNLNLPDNSIVRALQVFIDKEKLTEGVTDIEREIRLMNVEAVMGALKTDFIGRGFSATYEDGFLDITLEKYDSITDLYIASGRTGYESGGRDTNLNWGFWYNTYSYSDKTFFYDIKDTIIERLALDVESIDGIDPQDIAFVYNYGTAYKQRTINSDADNIYYYSKLGVNIHKFVMNETTLDRQYTIYQRAPNVITWYLMAMLIVALPSTAFTIYAYKKKKDADIGKE